MRLLLWFVISAISVIAIQVFGLELSAQFTNLVDPGIVVVVFFALGAGSVPAMLAGSLLGLLQDALSGGLFGLHGMANTIVAFSIARLRQQFVLTHLTQVAVALALAAAFQALVLLILGLVLGPSTAFLPGPTAFFWRITSSVGIGITIAALSSQLRQWRRKRRGRRRGRLRLGVG